MVLIFNGESFTPSHSTAILEVFHRFIIKSKSKKKIKPQTTQALFMCPIVFLHYLMIATQKSKNWMKRSEHFYGCLLVGTVFDYVLLIIHNMKPVL